MTELSEHRMTPEELTLEGAQSKLAAYSALGACGGLIIAMGLQVMVIRGTDQKNDATKLNGLHEHSTQLIMSSFFQTIAFALIAVVFGFLASAARNRLPQLPKGIVAVAYGGPALYAVSGPILALAQMSAAKDFVNGTDKSIKAANAALTGGFVEIASYVVIFAAFLLAIAWMVVGMYGMRIGLLTRLVGGVAIGIGVFTLILLYRQSPLLTLLQFFWLASLAVMLLATDETKPPAWRLGLPVAWREVDAARADGQELENYSK